MGYGRTHAAPWLIPPLGHMRLLHGQHAYCHACCAACMPSARHVLFPGHVSCGCRFCCFWPCGCTLCRLFSLRRAMLSVLCLGSCLPVGPSLHGRLWLCPVGLFYGCRRPKCDHAPSCACKPCRLVLAVPSSAFSFLVDL